MENQGHAEVHLGTVDMVQDGIKVGISIGMERAAFMMCAHACNIQVLLPNIKVETVTCKVHAKYAE